MLVIALSLELNTVVAVIMVGAALSVGFGVSRTLGRYRWGAVAIATLGMAAAAVLGSLVGNRLEQLFPLLALLSGGCAYLTSKNSDMWWVSLQTVVAFLVASHYPKGLDYALLRGLFVLLGGFLQLGGMMVFARFFPQMAPVLPSALFNTLPPSR
ncbi:hypothetical protein J2T38_000050 [Neisseria perflava]|nr:hypothetical protein [Neisseria perflava]